MYGKQRIFFEEKSVSTIPKFSKKKHARGICNHLKLNNFFIIYSQLFSFVSEKKCLKLLFLFSMNL